MKKINNMRLSLLITPARPKHTNIIITYWRRTMKNSQYRSLSDLILIIIIIQHNVGMCWCVMTVNII